MPSLLEAPPEFALAGQSKPLLSSYDSETEHSLDHWHSIRQMVEAEALLYADSDGRVPSSELCLGAW